MPRLLNELFARIAEGVGRRVIDLDDHAQALMTPVAGRCIAVMVEPLGLKFFVIAEFDNIVVLDTFDGQPDAIVSGRPSQFLDVMQNGASAAAVRQSGLKLEGNLEVIESFAAIAHTLDPDFEEYLSRFVGDGPARKLGLTARRLRSWFDTTSQRMSEDAGYYLREDSGLLITAEELEQFTDDVDSLRADVDRIKQRVKRINAAQRASS